MQFSSNLCLIVHQTGSDPTEEELEMLISEMTEERVQELLSGGASVAENEPATKKQRVEEETRVVRFLCFAT